MAYPRRDSLRAIFPGESEMAARLRCVDWGQCSLGAPQGWPQPLLTALSICLNSHSPLQVWWGPELTFFYNDATIPFLGPAQHPAALGQSRGEAWVEIWPTVGPMIEQVLLHRSARGAEDVLLFFCRDLPQEEAYVTFSFSPIFGENGDAEGVFAACTETTDKVVSLRRLATLARLRAEIGEPRSALDACRAACEALGKNPSDLPFAAVYLMREDHAKAHLAAVTGAAPGRWQPPKEVEFTDNSRLSQEPAMQLEMKLHLSDLEKAGGGKSMVLPLRAPAQAKLSGLLVVGVNPQIPFSGPYRSFLGSVASLLALNLADADAYEAHLRQDLHGMRETPFSETGEPPVREKKLSRDAEPQMLSLDGEIQRAVAEQTGKLEKIQAEHQRSEARLRQVIGELNLRAVQMEQECVDSRESRLAALNVMEDAIEARSALEREMAERQHTEDTMAIVQERLRLIVESAQEHAIISMNLARLVTSWNPGAERIFGYSAAQMIGTSADIVFSAEDQASGVAHHEVAAALTGGQIGDNRWLVRHDGSRFWADAVVLPMRPRPDGEVIGFVKILRDETEKRRAREELLTAWKETELAREQAEAAGRAKDDFLAMLSHELRTPLTPILMATRLLGRRKDLPEVVREALDMITRNVEIEARFVDDLLDLTRIERGKMELSAAPLDMHEVIRQAVEISRPDIEAKEQHLTLSLDAGRHELVGDAFRLQQVVWNLLKNAAKFTPKGGSISLRTRNDQGRLILEVEDNGIGIDAQALPHVFDAFAQANKAITREFGGLGLGLAISKASVQAHGGELRAASTGIGSGATFTATLPLIAEI